MSENIEIMSEKCPKSKEEKSVHDHHRKNFFGVTFLASKKTFQASGGYKNPVRTRKTISTTEIFPLWPPLFSAKKSFSLVQADVCFLFPRNRSQAQIWTFLGFYSFAGRAKLSTSAGEQNRALGSQVYGRYPNPAKPRKHISTIAFAGSARISAPRWW